MKLAADAAGSYPASKGTKSDWRKRWAAEIAAELLDNHNLPLTVTRRKEGRPASKFCQLAAVLYGEEQLDFFHYCRALKQHRDRFAGKL